MSIVECVEHRASRKASQTSGGTTYTRVFRVQTNSVDDGPPVVLAAAGLPVLFDVYPAAGSGTGSGSASGSGSGTGSGSGLPTAASSRLTKRDCAPYEDSDYQWLVTLTYEPVKASVAVNPPTDQPADISWGYAARTEIVWVDNAGNPVLNSAHSRFDPPIEDDVYMPLCRIVKNEATYSPSAMYPYQNSVNSDGVTIAGLAITAGQGLMRDISAVKRVEQDYEFWQVTYEIAFRPDGFLCRGVDSGFYELNAAGDGVVRIKDSAGRDIDEPRRLDGSGHVLAESGAAVQLAFAVKKTAAWTGLGLPTS